MDTARSPRHGAACLIRGRLFNTRFVLRKTPERELQQWHRRTRLHGCPQQAVGAGALQVRVDKGGLLIWSRSRK